MLAVSPMVPWTVKLKAQGTVTLTVKLTVMHSVTSTVTKSVT